jgi:hypothetical protein
MPAPFFQGNEALKSKLPAAADYEELTFVLAAK